MNYNNSHFKQLLTEPNKLLIEKLMYSVRKLSPIVNQHYVRNSINSLYDYAVAMIDIVKSGTSWKNYSGFVNGETLRKKHAEWVKLGVYDDLYESSLDNFVKSTPRTEELKYQSIDSTFIHDVNGCLNSNYSGIHKCRKGESDIGINITSIVTTSGIPISVTLTGANKYDSTVLPEAMDNIIIECDTKRYQNHNRYKQYILADKGYDSKNNHDISIKKGYTPLIAQNIRNTKDPKKIRIMNRKEKEIYKKRIKIENYHSWIKKFKKISSLYERNIDNYRGLLLVGISIIISRRIISNKT